MNRNKLNFAFTGLVRESTLTVILLLLSLLTLSAFLRHSIPLSAYLAVLFVFLLGMFLLIFYGARKEVNVKEYQKIQALIGTGDIDFDEFNKSLIEGKLNYYNFYYLTELATAKRMEIANVENQKELVRVKEELMKWEPKDDNE